MTDFTRVDALNDLLERVRRNAREPRPTFLATTDVAKQLITVHEMAPQIDEHDELPPESLAFDLVPAPKPLETEQGRHHNHYERNGFGDEATLTGSAEVVETLMLREQAEAARTQIRFEESVNRAPTTRPPPMILAAPAEETNDDAPEILVLDDLDMSADGPATEPPGGAGVEFAPVSLRTPPLPDVDAIEADLMSDGVADEVSHDRPAPSEDETPSSVRKPRVIEREEDAEFDGFGPVHSPSEPPPESGEVPSQRRVAGQHEPPISSPDNPYGIPGLDASGEVPSLVTVARHADEGARVALVEEAEEEVDDDLDAEDELAMSTSSRQWIAPSAEADADSTKEIRALGRVDVVERTRIAEPPDIVILKGEPRAVETFGSVFDGTLAIGRRSP